jgi:hypothetical protein
MQTFIDSLPTVKSTRQPLIADLVTAALSAVPFHKNTGVVSRYFAQGFPVHLAIHEVSPVTTVPEEYTQPHVHEDTDEVNIIISQAKLIYKIQIGNDYYTVGNNSSIWIPRGIVHAANVLSGSGYFITLRIN